MNDKIIVDSIKEQNVNENLTKSALQSLKMIKKFLTNNNIAAWDCLNEMDNIINLTILTNTTKTHQLTLEISVNFNAKVFVYV